MQSVESPAHWRRTATEHYNNSEKLGSADQHLYDRGGMREVHLRGRENILKRLMVHSGAANLGLLMRKLFGKDAASLAGRMRALSPGAAHPILIFRYLSGPEPRTLDESYQLLINDFCRGVKRIL